MQIKDYESKHACIWTCMCASRHACVHLDMHVCIQTYMCASRHAHVHLDICACMHVCIQTSMHMCTLVGRPLWYKVGKNSREVIWQLYPETNFSEMGSKWLVLSDVPTNTSDAFIFCLTGRRKREV